MGRLVLEPMTPAAVAQAHAYLARRPFDNVYVQWLIATGRAGGHDCAVARDGDGSIAGICTFGTHIVPCTDDDAASDLFASLARRIPVPRMIVGPRRSVERLWANLRRDLPKPLATRASQPVYALRPEDLRREFVLPGDAVGIATVAERDEVAVHSAEMIAGETGRAPDPRDAAFLTRTQRLIEAGWQWRYRVEGALAFQCNVAASSPQTAQIQGVWAPPEMRGRALATHGFATICARLLERHPTLSLYVNDFNAPAIALYERVGFARAGEFQTLLF